MKLTVFLRLKQPICETIVLLNRHKLSTKGLEKWQL